MYTQTHMFGLYCCSSSIIIIFYIFPGGPNICSSSMNYQNSSTSFLEVINSGHCYILVTKWNLTMSNFSFPLRTLVLIIVYLYFSQSLLFRFYVIIITDFFFSFFLWFFVVTSESNYYSIGYFKFISVVGLKSILV